jgi:hypothetical protein
MLVYLCLLLGWSSFGIFLYFTIAFLRDIREFHHPLSIAAQRELSLSSLVLQLFNPSVSQSLRLTRSSKIAFISFALGHSHSSDAGRGHHRRCRRALGHPESRWPLDLCDSHALVRLLSSPSLLPYFREALPSDLDSFLLTRFEPFPFVPSKLPGRQRYHGCRPSPLFVLGPGVSRSVVSRLSLYPRPPLSPPIVNLITVFSLLSLAAATILVVFGPDLSFTTGQLIVRYASLHPCLGSSRSPEYDRDPDMCLLPLPSLRTTVIALSERCKALLVSALNLFCLRRVLETRARCPNKLSPLMSHWPFDLSPFLSLPSRPREPGRKLLHVDWPRHGRDGRALRQTGQS